MKGVSAKAVPLGGEEAKRKARCKGGRLALPDSGPDGHKKTYGTHILVSKGINVNKITKKYEKNRKEIRFAIPKGFALSKGQPRKNRERVPVFVKWNRDLRP